MGRGALSAYFLYVKDNRASTKESNPEMTFGEIGRKMSADWKNLSAEDKEKYKSEAETAKKEYKKSHRYKKYLRDLEEWKELYKDEYEEQEYEKELKRENRKKAKEGKDKKKKDQKKTSKNKS